MKTEEKANGVLRRDIGLPGAVLMGLGSIIGTGIFVSIAIATEIAGNGIILAVVIAGALAAFNGLSSAQLAAAHPVSGGTYEYGYRFLNPYFGFAAGWMFLVAKSASAATAVLGCIAYFFFAFGIESAYISSVAAGLGLLLVMTLLVSGGIKRSNRANKIIVAITLLGLLSLVVAAWWVSGLPTEPLKKMHIDFSWKNTLYASALLFVAYTGYGRIATLGEEVNQPAVTIPKAIITAMILIVLLYLLIGMTAIHVMGAEAFGKTVGGDSAPLMAVSRALSLPVIETVVTIAAITAMLGVFLNLLLGLSRVVLSMARRGDLPGGLSRISPSSGSPNPAIWTTAFVIGILIVSGNMVFTWTFSAFTVLIYYAITNLAALFLPDEFRLYPRWVAMGGLFGCVFLTLWIEPQIWVYGMAVLLAGLAGNFVKNILKK